MRSGFHESISKYSVEFFEYDNSYSHFVVISTDASLVRLSTYKSLHDREIRQIMKLAGITWNAVIS